MTCRAQRNFYSRFRTCQLFMRPRQLGLRTIYARDIRGISARISFSPRSAMTPLLDWLPRCVAHASLQSEELRRVWSRLLILCCDPTTEACLCSQNAPVQDCRSLLWEMKVVTNSGVHWIAVIGASGISTCITIHGCAA